VDFLNFVLTNDARKLQPGQGQYTILCNERGGAIDDLYVYRLDDEEFLLMVNASRIEADFAWLKKQLAAFPGGGAVELKNRSDELAAVAVQGPKVAGFIDHCFPASAQTAAALQKNEIARFNFAGRIVWVSRTGYTGEDGFEIVAEADIIEALWDKLLEVGHRPASNRPGWARATRCARRFAIRSTGMNWTRTPLRWRPAWATFVALGKGEFMGRAVLAQQKAQGTKRKLAAFQNGRTRRAAPSRLFHLERRRWHRADRA
jgi:aminomethyltransferase